jgi:hypothetical protein
MARLLQGKPPEVSFMKVQCTLLAGLLAAGIAAPVLQARASGGGGGDKDIKLTGCLIKGEGDGGYLITNLPSEPAPASGTASVATTAIGTAGGFATMFYWLDGDGDLKHHVGHRVEIDGHVKGDLKDGEIKLERKDNWTELRVKSDGRSMKAQVPNAYIVPASDHDKDQKMTALVRRVDVDHVRMLSANCQ